MNVSSVTWTRDHLRWPNGGLGPKVSDAGESFDAHDGHDRRVLVEGVSGSIDVGPNGALAFCRSVGDGKSPPTLWVADADGSNQRQISEGPNAWLPNWSPDGTRIATSAANRETTQFSTSTAILTAAGVLEGYIDDASTFDW